MRIVVALADEGACGHFRARWPAEALRAEGFDVVVLPPGKHADAIPVQVGMVRDRERLVEFPHAIATGAPDFDVLVLQRPLDWRIPAAITMLREMGVRVVVDLDDDLTALPRTHTAWARLEPGLSPMYNHRHLVDACKAADRVVVSTPALLSKFGGGGRGRLVRNCVPSSWLNVTRERPEGPLWLGWTGRVASHPDSLDQLRWRRLAVSLGPGVEFVVLGDAAGADQQLGVDVVEVPGVPIDEYPWRVADFDVGVAPLARTPFNRAKSWLKPLDYAAAGVPFVASDLPEYRLFVEQGAGLLAEKARDWERQLGRLVGDERLRAELAGKAAEVAAEWTFDVRVDEWATAWTEV